MYELFISQFLVFMNSLEAWYRPIQ
jgi:hypothetical protein